MQPSPLRLLRLCFSSINIQPEQSEFDGKDIKEFDFNGVSIGEATNTIPVKDDPPVYRVILRIIIGNKEGKKAPYKIDICAYGDFHVSEKRSLEEQHNLVTVNGCAMLYGAIRELVMTLTSRFDYGMMTLPSVNFLDKIKKEPAPESSPMPVKKTPRKQKTASTQSSRKEQA